MTETNKKSNAPALVASLVAVAVVGLSAVIITLFVLGGGREPREVKEEETQEVKVVEQQTDGTLPETEPKAEPEEKTSEKAEGESAAGDAATEDQATEQTGEATEAEEQEAEATETTEGTDNAEGTDNPEGTENPEGTNTAEGEQNAEGTEETSLSGDPELDQYLDDIIANYVGESNGVDDSALYAAYEYVANNYYYTEMNEYPPGDWSEWSPGYAKEMYLNKTGNCYRFSSLFCWIARRLGYDAVVISGQVPQQGELVAHGWVEVHRDGQSYVCDPDLHKFRPEYNLFMVSYEEAPLDYTKIY